MSETTTISASDILCNLKGVVADLECQQKQQILKQLQQQLQREEQQEKRREQQREQISKSPAQPPMFLMIPVEDTQKCEGDKRSPTYAGQENKHCSSNGSTAQSQGKKTEKKSHNSDDHSLELKGVKSRELRAGILYTGCGCLHRDGLQDNCPRSACQGQPDCLVKPWAACPPGLLCRSRHPECFGAPPNPDAMTI